MALAVEGNNCAGKGQADAAVVFFEGHGVRRHHWRRLGQAIALVDHDASDFLPAFRRGRHYRHTAGRRQLQRREVDRPYIRVIHQRLVQGVHPRDGREPAATEFADEPFQIAWIGDQKVVATRIDVAQAVTHQRVHVIERQRRHHEFMAGHDATREPRIDLAHVGHEVGVRQHRATGSARGSARVLQAREVGSRRQ
jgi:hypothetical protein